MLWRIGRPQSHCIAIGDDRHHPAASAARLGLSKSSMLLPDSSRFGAIFYGAVWGCRSNRRQRKSFLSSVGLVGSVRAICKNLKLFSGFSRMSFFSCIYSGEGLQRASVIRNAAVLDISP